MKPCNDCGKTVGKHDWNDYYRFCMDCEGLYFDLERKEW